MSDLIDTTEMYLKVVFELEEQREPALRARLAERLGQAMPSVSQTVGRLERDGLLRLNDNRIVELTEEGRAIAVAVMRKHRVAERFLYDVLELDWAECHDEACRWEHVLGDAAELKLAGLLKDLTADPYGNPIPGLDVFGMTSAPSVDGVPASGFADGESATLVAIGEGAQAEPHLLADCAAAGVVPGNSVSIQHDKAGTSVIGPAGTVHLDAHLAAQMFVSR